MHTRSRDLSGQVTLKDAMGNLWAFQALDDAFRFILQYSLNPVPHSPDRVIVCDGRKILGNARSVAVRDACGLIIPVHILQPELDRLDRERLKRSMARHRRPSDYDQERDFRNRPVPRTGGRSSGRFFRYIKTQAERRDHLGLEADLRDLEDFPIRVKIRGRRKNVPTAWDDIAIGRRGDGWKNYRKAQYKE